MAEVENTFGAYHVFRPVKVDEAVEFLEVEGLAAEVNEGADTVFFGFAFIVVVMMVMAES